ncbi:MAG: SufE family protein [Chloroflexaceae bacterium]|nr:SufE family protein [Chloroflexaceae bacterium]NJL34948.1 SufE family protein [Chloroflexaceae bacterium]NJO06259.1 SufE family protein [Chloroflexaceae bacterium]
MTVMQYIPPRLQEIIEDFRLVEGEEKLHLLLEYSEQMPPLPEWLNDHHDEMQQVHECMAPVFVYAELHDGKMQYYFDVPPESPTVRGYAAMLGIGLNGEAPETVMQVPSDFFYQMGLQSVLSPQRLNGVTAVLAYMKRLAMQHVNTA